MVMTRTINAISRSSRPSASPLSIDFGRQRGLPSILGLPGRSGRGGIEHRHLAERVLLALEHVEQRLGILGGIAAL